MQRFITIIILVIMTITGFALSNRQQYRLVDMQREMGLTSTDPMENAPPLVAFSTIALGGFRGILADLLWLRSMRLQDEGRYFELMQLSHWITQLEPRFPEVWGNQAWNMSYNISMLYTDPNDRWRWINNGIKLLRDEGIPNNEGLPNLYKELAWMYFHKIAATLDEYQEYNKRALAYEMQDVLGGPHPKYDELLSAAKSLADLQDLPGMQDLFDGLRELDFNPNSTVLLKRDILPESVLTLLDTSPAGPDLLKYLRRQRLVKDLKLDPEYMKMIDDDYGELDWRMPQAHAIYWARKGQERCTKKTDIYSKRNLDRVVYASLNDALRNGSLSMDRESGLFLFTSNLNLLPALLESYREQLRMYPNSPSAKTGFRHTLEEGISMSYAHHHTKMAQDLFDEFKEKYPEEVGDLDFDAFILRAIQVGMEDLDDRTARARLEGYLFQSEIWNKLGETERALGYLRLAKLFRQRYMESLSEGQEFIDRLGLAPLQEVRDDVKKKAAIYFEKKSDPTVDPE